MYYGESLLTDFHGRQVTVALYRSFDCFMWQVSVAVWSIITLISILILEVWTLTTVPVPPWPPRHRSWASALNNRPNHRSECSARRLSHGADRYAPWLVPMRFKMKRWKMKYSFTAANSGFHAAKQRLLVTFQCMNMQFPNLNCSYPLVICQQHASVQRREVPGAWWTSLGLLDHARPIPPASHCTFNGLSSLGSTIQITNYCAHATRAYVSRSTL
jgi:hypothetical protein